MSNTVRNKELVRVKERYKLLFCGEIPPFSINGVSLTNNRILKVLSERIDIIQVIEKRIPIRSGVDCFFKTVFIFFNCFSLALMTIKWRPAIFYTTFSTSLFGGMKCLLFIFQFKLLSPGRVILHVHRGDLINFYKKGWMSKFLVDSCFKRVSTILALSLQQSILYSGITSTPVLSISNSVEISSEGEWKSPSLIRLIYLSNYLADKGLETLLDAFKEIRNGQRIELHCYGGGDPSYFIKKIQVESISNVHIHGILSEKEKYKILHGFSMLVFPSYNEGQPLVILEAMAVGLPIVSTNVGLIPEMLGEDYPFLVPPQDSKALAQAIESCIGCSNPHAIGMRLKTRFLSSYSPVAQKERILEVFEC